MASIAAAVGSTGTSVDLLRFALFRLKAFPGRGRFTKCLLVFFGSMSSEPTARATSFPSRWTPPCRAEMWRHAFRIFGRKSGVLDQFPSLHEPFSSGLSRVCPPPASAYFNGGFSFIRTVDDIAGRKTHRGC